MHVYSPGSRSVTQHLVAVGTGCKTPLCVIFGIDNNSSSTISGCPILLMAYQANCALQTNHLWYVGQLQVGPSCDTISLV